MELEQLNNILAEELRLNEGVRDIWPKVKQAIGRVGQLKFKKIANAFFKKHPGLLEHIKTIAQGHQEESLNESKFSKTLLAIGFFFALGAGFLPQQAAASNMIRTSTGITQQQFHVSTIDGFSKAIIDRVEQAGQKINSESLLGATQEMFQNLRFVDESGEVFQVDDKKSIKRAVSSDGIFMHDNEVTQTGSMDKPQLQNAVRLVVNSMM